MTRNEMMAAGLKRSASRLEAERNSASSVPGDDDHRAAERQLQPPAVADPADDVDELRATVGPADSVRHVGALLKREYTVARGTVRGVIRRLEDVQRRGCGSSRQF